MIAIKIRDLSVFSNLSKVLDLVEQSVPGHFDAVCDQLEKVERDLSVNIQETENEILDLEAKVRQLDIEAKQVQQSAEKECKGQNAPRGQNGESPSSTDNEKALKDISEQTNNLKSKLAKVRQRHSKLNENSGKIRHIILMFNGTKRRFSETLLVAKRSKNSLKAFESFALKYLDLTKFSNVIPQTGLNAFSLDHSGLNIRYSGETFHVSKNGQIDQQFLSSLEEHVKSSTQTCNKISIDQVSSSEFDLLKGRGYTILELGPNEFSAYKTCN